MNYIRRQGGDAGQQNLFLAEQLAPVQSERDERNSRHGIEDFLELLQSLRDDFFAKGELSKKVRKLTEKIDYWSYLVAEHSKNENKARWKFSNIEYLLKMIEDWEKDPDNLDSGLYAYLNRVSLITRSDGDDTAGSGKVNLMTIHAAKGLEFPVVFIAGAEEGIIPHERSLEDEGDEIDGASGAAGGDSKAVEEERRLFYVAITRARDKLYITSCQKRRRQQNYNERVPSPFLAEIPPHLIEVREMEVTEENPSESADNFFARMRERFG
jgi:DNA helicase-2/ATP-dependent DNA helicase PcrA